MIWFVVAASVLALFLLGSIAASLDEISRTLKDNQRSSQWGKSI